MKRQVPAHEKAGTNRSLSKREPDDVATIEALLSLTAGAHSMRRRTASFFNVKCRVYEYSLNFVCLGLGW